MMGLQGFSGDWGLDWWREARRVRLRGGLLRKLWGWWRGVGGRRGIFIPTMEYFHAGFSTRLYHIAGKIVHESWDVAITTWGSENTVCPDSRSYSVQTRGLGFSKSKLEDAFNMQFTRDERQIDRRQHDVFQSSMGEVLWWYRSCLHDNIRMHVKR